METKKQRFIAMMKEAKDRGAKYIFTEMYIIGYQSSEIIINPIANAEKKVDYICDIYNDNLEMVKDENGNGLKVVEILSFGYCDNLGQLEYELINFEELH